MVKLVPVPGGILLRDKKRSGDRGGGDYGRHVGK